MDMKKVFDTIQRTFSSNGFITDKCTIKIQNPTNLSIKASGKNIIVTFSDPPMATFKASLGFINPSISRKITSITFSSDEISVGILDFPDFTFSY